MKRLVGFILLTLTVAAFVAACNGTGTNPRTFDTYRIDGSLIIDMNRDSVFVSVTLFDEDSLATAATIMLEGRPLTFNSPLFPTDSVFSLREDSAIQYVNRDLMLTLSDTSGFEDTLFINVPDTFSILEVIPFTHRTEGLENVSLNWSASAGTFGYTIAAVHRDSVYREFGYSAIPTPNTGTGGTIPPDAFNFGPGDDPDTGLYNLYVYSLGAVTDSSQSSPLLPVPLPAEFSDNISQPNFIGQFGATLVAPKDTVRVVTNP